jgi:caffeoyl-CoA O-methyltransferase
MADDQSRRGTTYDSPEIRQYLEGLFCPPDPAFADALAALDRSGMPRIQVAPNDGRILEVLLALAGARRVVEFGTLSGYSALWMLRALGPEGHLWTCEIDQKHAEVARGVFERAGVADRVSLLVGPGAASLERLTPYAPFDAVFLDADKVGYPRYARWAFEHLRPGGLLLADNTYLFGYLAGRSPDAQWDAEAIAAMRAFHEFLAAHFLAVCLPTPDGLSVGIKPAK